MAYIEILPLSELEHRKKVVFRADGKQILLLSTEDGVFAVPNRCPHEGYPLSEGALTERCVLTCNWHNWKFELATGRTLVGGDRLTRYPVQIREGAIWLDLVPPDPVVRRREIFANLSAALEDADQQRLVRETARLARLGADPVDAVRIGVAWIAERLEFGTTHAIAGAPDWLALNDRSTPGSAERLAALGEILGHLADDALPGRGRHYPFALGEAAWDAAAFAAAIEREDETAGQRLLRGALSTGMSAPDLLPALAESALTHYADFGHSLIYAVKSVKLIERLGAESAAPVLAMLVRSLVYATREDMLPEFRDYAGQLADWGKPAEARPLAPALLRRTSAKSAMALVREWSAVHPARPIFAALVEAAGWTLLHVDEQALTRVDAKLADNIGWLDFTHPLTFADAALDAVRLRPDLWPAILLQLACFVGRNAGYADPAINTGAYRVDDPQRFVEESIGRLFDHGRDRFIISVHVAKTLLAGHRLMQALPDQAAALAAAFNRFANAPIKGRHVLRTALQMQELVEQE